LTLFAVTATDFESHHLLSFPHAICLTRGLQASHDTHTHTHTQTNTYVHADDRGEKKKKKKKKKKETSNDTSLSQWLSRHSACTCHQP